MTTTIRTGRPLLRVTPRAHASNEPRFRAPGSRRREDALDVLRAGHERIAQLFARFDALASSGPRKASLVERICEEIELHARLEKEIFYPSLRPAIDDQALIDEAAVEHETARSMVALLRALRPGERHYDAKVSMLGDYVRRHADHEEREIFPRAQQMTLDLVALARALKARRRQLKGGVPARRPAGAHAPAGEARA
jgi:hemerythrin-like domain-containing protein